MPYIKPERRKEIVIEEDIPAISLLDIQNAGELQYAIALMIKFYMAGQPNNYQARNDVMGALAGAQMEFYRRHVVPYENDKITENGDV